MRADGESGCNFLAAERAEQNDLLHYSPALGDILLECCVNIIIALTFGIRAFALRRHVVRPEKRFMALGTLDSDHFASPGNALYLYFPCGGK